MTSKHTPGPWKLVQGNEAYAIAAADELVVRGGCGCCSGAYDSIDLEADARLIAAAPDLLEALEAMYEMFNGNGITPDDDDAIIAARAAIAKATGANP